MMIDRASYRYSTVDAFTFRFGLNLINIYFQLSSYEYPLWIDLLCSSHMHTPWGHSLSRRQREHAPDSRPRRGASMPHGAPQYPHNPPEYTTARSSPRDVSSHRGKSLLVQNELRMQGVVACAVVEDTLAQVAEEKETPGLDSAACCADEARALTSRVAKRPTMLSRACALFVEGGFIWSVHSRCSRPREEEWPCVGQVDRPNYEDIYSMSRLYDTHDEQYDATDKRTVTRVYVDYSSWAALSPFCRIRQPITMNQRHLFV